VDLLDWAETQKIARITDPETSHIAAGSVSSRLVGLRLEFLRGLELCGGIATANEAAAAMSPDHSHRESIRKRAKECVDNGGACVLDVRRKCKVTGNMCRLYQLVVRDNSGSTENVK
jgi:hypothetical protein